MKTTTIQFDQRSQEEIDKLKRAFSSNTNASVIRKALALAAMIVQEAGDDSNITIIGDKSKEPIRVNISR